MHNNNLKKRITYAAVFVLGISQIFGQVENTEETSLSLVESLSPEILQVVSETQVNLPSNLSNSIYIQQIGTDNSASVNLQTTSNELNLLQNGNSNLARIDISAKAAIHNIAQEGNGNFLIEYGNRPDLTLERNINQNGNDHGVVIFGSNSLTDNIFLNLQGNSKTITIRNFN